MLEILLKNKEMVRVRNTDEISDLNLDFHIMQFIDYTTSDINWAKDKFGLDFSIMLHYEDIEISSHFLENEHQASFHISIPFYTNEKKMVEEPIFFIMTSSGLFTFLSSSLDEFINRIYAGKFTALQELSSTSTIFKAQIEFISDFYADITEGLTKKIMLLANRVLIEKEFTNADMDVITGLNFNNLLIKESLIETTRVFNLYKKSKWEKRIGIKAIVETELDDLSVVSDYIQFNFDRLDDLKENISNKIDLEQNHIFKILTIVTVCISLPTLMAGIYGMNFEKMPELKTAYGYPVVLIVMVLSAVLPFLYFRRKKWI